MTLKSGWCMTRRHGHYCRWNLCQCDCHNPDAPTVEASRMERSRKVRKHPAAPNPAQLDNTEEQG